MRRRYGGQDVGLAVRMVVVLAFLALVYIGMGWVVWRLAGEAWYYLFVVPALMIWCSKSASGLVLRFGDAQPLDRRAYATVYDIVDRLCALGTIRTPELALSEDDNPNAYTVTHASGRSTVTVTSGLLERLDEAELEAVLAHELMHIANYDSYVLTPASFLASLGALLYRGLTTWVPLWFVPYVVGSGVMFTLSRYREYVADRGAAILTGAPEQLMSALQKIAAEMPAIPSDDLRSYAGLNAFFIVPSHPYRTRWELRMDHPPLSKRLARLSELARELGKPVR